jgi:hypothetical protein
MRVRHRMVAALKHGMPRSEAATTVGVSRSIVKRRLARHHHAVATFPNADIERAHPQIWCASDGQKRVLHEVCTAVRTSPRPRPTRPWAPVGWAAVDRRLPRCQLNDHQADRSVCTLRTWSSAGLGSLLTHPHGFAWSGFAVRLVLTVRRFVGDVLDCVEHILPERMAAVTMRDARRTNRLAAVLRVIAFATGGAVGSRLLDRLPMRTSAATLLRMSRRTPRAWD